MTDIRFMLHESVAGDLQQRGICWQVKDDAYVPIHHPQIKNSVPRNGQGGLLESLNQLPSGAPGRVEKELNSKFRITPGQLSRGQYFPRIVRPIFGEDGIQPGQTFKDICDRNALRDIQMQEKILVEMLEDIFRSVHPDQRNLDVFGHQIRNLIILATTEVESSLAAILRANGITPRSKDFTTNDYIRLRDPLKLHEFEVSLLRYPWLRSFSPFRDWDDGQPTQSLKWYDAYNKIKHNRETEFPEAKLLHSIDAIIAVHILLVSQFGEWGTFNPYFKLIKKPLWPQEQLYIPPEEKSKWTPVNLAL